MESEKSKMLAVVAKRTVTQVTDYLEQYEKPDYLYEVLTIATTGKLPTSYKVLRGLAIGSKLLKDVTRR